MEQIIDGKGAQRDERDERDHLFRDLQAAGAVAPVMDQQWRDGFSVYAQHGLKAGKRDQAGRQTCTCEAAAEYARVLRFITTGEDVTFAASSVYPLIRLPNGGAYIRDAAAALASGKFAPKSVIADEDANGWPVSEAVASDKARITAAVTAAAQKLDVYDNYRMLEGGTDSIDLFAAAIVAGNGILMGFTGTNPGWTCPACRAPLPGESQWGHCVYAGEFGLTDVDAPGLPAGSKAIFIPNSWGGRYTFTTGRWAGRQAIPESYFLATIQTAVGTVAGGYVFPSWTVVPSSIVPPSTWAADWLKQRDRKLLRNVKTGARALVTQGRFQPISEQRAGFAAIACIDYGIDASRREDVDDETWQKLPATPF